MIKAIETTYKGYRFRSRLEARWAVVFDSLGLQWSYEDEGFVLPSGAHYLPDFKITFPVGKSIYCEVKGAWIGDLFFDAEWLASLDKPREFATNSDEIVYVLGNIPATSQACAVILAYGIEPRLRNPFEHMLEWYGIDCAKAFSAGRSARFEHGEAQHGR